MYSSGHEIPVLGLDWGFMFKVTATCQIPTSFLADATSNHSTVPIRNERIALPVKFLCLESELQKCLASVSFIHANGSCASYFNSMGTLCIFNGKILGPVIFQFNFYACSLDAFHLQIGQQQHTLISERFEKVQLLIHTWLSEVQLRSCEGDPDLVTTTDLLISVTLGVFRAGSQGLKTMIPK